MIRTSPRSFTATEQVARWLTGFGVVGLRALKTQRRIVGLAGVDMVIGSARSSAGSFRDMVMGDSRTVRIRVVPPHAGEAVDDALVVMRLNQFAPLLEAWIEKNSHRLYGEE